MVLQMILMELLQIMNMKKLQLSKNVSLLMSKKKLKIAILLVQLMKSSKSEKADEAVTEVADDEEAEDCLTVADRPAAMVVEASGVNSFT